MDQRGKRCAALLGFIVLLLVCGVGPGGSAAAAIGSAENAPHALPAARGVPLGAENESTAEAIAPIGRSCEPGAPSSALAGGVQVHAWQEFDPERRRPIPVRLYAPGERSGPVPLVLFSTGLGRPVESCDYLGRQWAAFGIASVHVGHAGSDEAAWRGSLRPKKTLREAFENPRNILDRPRDLQFVLDQLERRRMAGDSRVAGLDLRRVGAAGHDFGAQTVLALSGQILPGGARATDARVRAVVAMSPPVEGLPTPYQAAFAGVTIPCLFITGTEDDGWVGSTTASQRRIPFELSPAPESYLLTLQGADHMVYAGHPVAVLRGRDDGKYQRVIAAVTTWFWQAHLNADPRAEAWLSSAPSTANFGGLARWEVRRDASATAAPATARFSGSAVAR